MGEDFLKEVLPHSPFQELLEGGFSYAICDQHRGEF